MTKPNKLDWAIASIIAAIAATGLVVWLLPSTETKPQCIRRVTDEISSRKKAVGETTIKNREEIEAIAYEIKSKCP